MSVFAGSALLCGTARADLTLTDMFIVSGWDPMTGEPIFVEDGEAFSITSEQDQLQFWVRVKLASRTGPTNISGNQLVVTGNPLLNFQLTSKTGSTVIRRTASYTGITDYDPTDGEAMYMLFAYTPQATDYYHGVSLAYGGTALINLGTGGSIATDEPSDGSLPVSASGQLCDFVHSMLVASGDGRFVIFQPWVVLDNAQCLRGRFNCFFCHKL